MGRARLAIDRTWDGEPAPAGEHARVDLAWDDAALRIAVEAPLHGDPPPGGPPGPTFRLWEHEVVEVFLLGTDERYLEIELGPHGHHLVLRLAGRRRVEEHGLPLAYRVGRETPGRWIGRARAPAAWLPAGLERANAYAIHGQGDARRYLAAHAVPGAEPDFHRLECFPRLADLPEPD